MIPIITDARSKEWRMCPLIGWSSKPGAVGGLHAYTDDLALWAEDNLALFKDHNLAVLLGSSDSSAQLLLGWYAAPVGEVIRRWSMFVPDDPTAWCHQVRADLRANLWKNSDRAAAPAARLLGTTRLVARMPPTVLSGPVQDGDRGGDTTDMGHASMQPPGVAEGTPPVGGPRDCITVWIDPVAFLPGALADSAQRSADHGATEPVGREESGAPKSDEHSVRLPYPGYPKTLVFDPPSGDPGRAWWGPGNDDRAQNARCPSGCPGLVSWWQCPVDAEIARMFVC